MDGQTGNASVIYRESGNLDQLVLHAGTGGIRIMDNTGTNTLLQVTPDGNLIVSGKVITSN
jgi:hypothetical protein